jgi:hypothetical protein
MPNLTTRSTPLLSAPASPAPLFRRAQRYEVFCFVKPPHGLTPRGATKLRTFWHSQCHPSSQRPLSPSRERKGTKFLTFVSTPLSPASCFSKIMPNLTTRSTPLSSAPASPAPLFRGAQRYEVFRFVKPSHSLALRGTAKLRTFWHSQCHPSSQRPLSPSRERKGTKFFALSSPPFRLAFP